jgi:hypothetical protein
MKYILFLALFSTSAFAATEVNCKGVPIRNSSTGSMSFVRAEEDLAEGTFHFNLSRQGHHNEVRTIEGKFEAFYQVVGTEFDSGTSISPTNRNLKSRAEQVTNLDGSAGPVQLMMINLDWPAAPGNSWVRLKTGEHFYMNCSEK